MRQSVWCCSADGVGWAARGRAGCQGPGSMCSSSCQQPCWSSLCRLGAALALRILPCWCGSTSRAVPALIEEAFAVDSGRRGLCPAGVKGRLVPPVELTLPQILQRMMGYNVVAVLNQLVTSAAFPGGISTCATNRSHANALTQNLPDGGKLRSFGWRGL